MKINWDKEFNFNLKIESFIDTGTEGQVRQCIADICEQVKNGEEVREGDSKSYGDLMVVVEYVNVYKNGKIKDLEVSVWRAIARVNKK